jgi:hypothetical protein
MRRLTVCFYADPHALPEGMAVDDLARMACAEFLIRWSASIPPRALRKRQDRYHKVLWDILDALLGSGPGSHFADIEGISGGPAAIGYAIDVQWRRPAGLRPGALWFPSQAQFEADLP